MKIIEKRYCLIGWREKIHFVTAKQLYERVMEDSKSNYDWIAPASELVKVCARKGFPKHYEKEIKIAILNCFANLELNRTVENNLLPSDDDAVYFCYNSLSGTDEKIVQAKRNYLIAVIKSTVLYYYELPIHFGPIFKTKCDDWIKSKFNENIAKEKIHFKSFLNELNEDFEKMIRKAENDGLFKEEDEAYYNELVERAFNLMKIT